MKRFGLTIMGAGVAAILAGQGVQAQEADPPPPPRDGDHPARGERAFDALDANHNGTISRDEFLDRAPKMMERFKQAGGSPPPAPPPQEMKPHVEEMNAHIEEMKHRIAEMIDRRVHEVIERELAGRKDGPMHDRRPGMGPREGRRDGERGDGPAHAFEPPGPGPRGPMAGPRPPRFDDDRPGDRGPRFGGPDGERKPRAGRPDGERGRRFGGPDGERGPRAGGPDGERGPRQGPPSVFGRLDTNHDGKLQTAELQGIVDAMTKVLDASKNHDVTLDEWIDAMKSFRPDAGPGEGPGLRREGRGPGGDGPRFEREGRGPNRDRPDDRPRRARERDRDGGDKPEAAAPAEPPVDERAGV